MRDGAVSVSKLITLGLWAWTTCCLVLAWMAWLMLEPNSHVPDMFGYTACASSAVAATAQIRQYALHICSILRANAVMIASAGKPERLHSLN